MTCYLCHKQVVVQKNSPRGVHFRRAGPRQRVWCLKYAPISFKGNALSTYIWYKFRALSGLLRARRCESMHCDVWWPLPWAQYCHQRVGVWLIPHVQCQWCLRNTGLCCCYPRRCKVVNYKCMVTSFPYALHLVHVVSLFGKEDHLFLDPWPVKHFPGINRHLHLHFMPVRKEQNPCHFTSDLVRKLFPLYYAYHNCMFWGP